MSDFPAISDYELPMDERARESTIRWADSLAMAEEILSERQAIDAAHARAGANAERDLQRRIDRGRWPPKIYTENGVSYMLRPGPLRRRR